MKNNKKQTVCVIGLGYVGLPLAIQCALKGYTVYGLDKDQEKIKKIRAGKSPLKDKFIESNLPKVSLRVDADEKVICQADIVLICVPTPVDKNFYPNLEPVKSAAEAVAKNLKKGQLVIVESTINPGVCEEVVEPIFAAKGYRIGKDYEMAHCPERINPGDPKWNVTNINRVVGSFTAKGLKKAKEFYESIIDAEIYPMKTIRAAEAVKIMENSFRDINIAFVNELAKSFDRLGIDIVDVIRGAATKPFSFMPHWPSCGVGGHCIPVDPYYLIERAKLSGFDHEFLKIARKINNSMPEYTVEILQDALNEIKKPMNGVRVGILGLSYKANVGDLRETPSLKIIDLIKKHKARVEVFDPYFPQMSTVKNLKELLRRSEAIVLATDHQEFKEILPEIFYQHKIKVIVDGKNCLNKEALKKYGIIYKGIGH